MVHIFQHLGKGVCDFFLKKSCSLWFGPIDGGGGEGGGKLVWLAVAGKVALSTWIRHLGGQSDA